MGLKDSTTVKLALPKHMFDQTTNVNRCGAKACHAQDNSRNLRFWLGAFAANVPPRCLWLESCPSQSLRNRKITQRIRALCQVQQRRPAEVHFLNPHRGPSTADCACGWQPESVCVGCIAHPKAHGSCRMQLTVAYSDFHF